VRRKKGGGGKKEKKGIFWDGGKGKLKGRKKKKGKKDFANKC